MNPSDWSWRTECRPLSVSERRVESSSRGQGRFGMKVLAIDITEISGGERGDYGFDLAGRPLDLDRALREADYVSLHLPLNDETRHIIEDRRLRLMKPGAFLINVSRGALVDEEALAAAFWRDPWGEPGSTPFFLNPGHGQFAAHPPECRRYPTRLRRDGWHGAAPGGGRPRKRRPHRSGARTYVPGRVIWPRPGSSPRADRG